MSRLRLFLLAAVVLVVAVGCQVHTQVEIDVAEDGSGTVTVSVVLDAEARRRLGDPATALRLDDLRQAGWAIEDPATGDDETLTFVAVREFAAPEQLGSVLDEIGGSEGVFRSTELQVSDGFATTAYDFTTNVELTGSLEQFSDADLAAALDGLPLARSAEELAAEGATDPEAATLDVAVDLPGGTPETNGEVADGAASWSFSASSGEATSEELRSSSSTSSGTTTVLVGVAVVAGVLAILALVAGLVVRRRA